MKYIRVTDPTSGHQFDRPENDPLIALGELVPLNSDRWPDSDIERPAKFQAHPKSVAARPHQSASASAAPQDATEKE